MPEGDPKAAKAAFEELLGKTSPEEAAANAARVEARKVAESRAREEAAKAAEYKAVLEQVKNDPIPDPKSMGGKRRHSRVTAKRFCSCIKKVKTAKKPKTEGSAIAICTSSLLWPHGRTLHSVTCRRKKSLKTQKRKK